ncbi:MAG: selenide, water dikinase SelD, partial [Thermodesulfovibrionales bacterium]
MISSIQKRIDGSVLVGPGDDAGVFLINKDLAIVETVDIITPVVNDPYTFGRISAVNSLSDIYAMGGSPLTALAVLGYSSCDYEPVVIKEILRGATDTLNDVGVSLMGGHSFEDSEIKFGLSVTGIIKPANILRVSGAMPADLIILTKPLGIGILTTALKAGKVSEEDISEAIGWMLRPNREASEIAIKASATSLTDVTGFGLLGHASNMVRDSMTDFVIEMNNIPLLKGVMDFISSGIIPEGAYNNLRFLEGKVDFDASIN